MVGNVNRCSALTRRIFVANLVAQAGIVVTGAIVRLTGSGLGCPTWPECVDGSVLPTSSQVESWHKYVEFGNRLLTFVLVILAIAALLAALLDRRARSRRSLLLWATVPLLGTVVQAILGGITVLTGLAPGIVAAHFLVSMLIIAGCVQLVARSYDPQQPGTQMRVSVRRVVWLLVLALVVTTAVVIVLGVLVTGTGPHSGDTGVDARLPLDPRVISWLHADAVFAFLGLSVGVIAALRIVQAPRASQLLALSCLAIALVQGAVGYTQYFTGLPIVLVAIHVLLACVLWIAVLFLPMSLREPVPIVQPTKGSSATARKSSAR